jgi:hypothetical protein
MVKYLRGSSPALAARHERLQREQQQLDQQIQDAQSQTYAAWSAAQAGIIFCIVC